MKLQVLVIEDESNAIPAIRGTIQLVRKEFEEFEDDQIDERNRIDAQLKEDLRGKDYHLVVLDIGLPGENGFKAFPLIADRNVFGEAKIIVHTAHPEAQKADRILEALYSGAFSYVFKGDSERLEQEVRRALSRIRGESYQQMLGTFVDIGFRRKVMNPAFSQALRKGCITKKAVLFCDISSSTEFVKTLQQQRGSDRDKVGPVLRELFSWMARIIQKHGGMIDKFIGDEVMAYFGEWMSEEGIATADETKICEAAVDAALEIKQQFASQYESALRKHDVQTRVKPQPDVKGVVHYNTVFWGILGAESYQDLTILTDSVVKAARLMQHSTKVRNVEKKFITGGDLYVTRQVVQHLRQDQYILGAETDVTLRNFETEAMSVQKVEGRKLS